MMESSVVVKAFGLLEALGHFNGGCSLGKLAMEVGISKPSAHRVLKTLAALGYVERRNPGIYFQTSRARLSFGAITDERLLAVSESFLRQLHKATRETVNLGVLRNGRILYLEVLQSPHPLRHVSPKGTSDPFHTTALGRAIVSQLPKEQQLLLLRKTALESRTASTITHPEKLGRILDEVKGLGYAFEQDQTDLGVACIGAPVFESGAVTAAISVSVPTARLIGEMKRFLLARVCSTAKRLSAELDRKKTHSSTNR